MMYGDLSKPQKKDLWLIPIFVLVGIFLYMFFTHIEEAHEKNCLEKKEQELKKKEQDRQLREDVEMMKREIQKLKEK